MKSDEQPLPANHTPLGQPSYLDLSAELDDAVRRDAEELGRPCRNAYEAGIDALAPPCHPGPQARCDIGAPDEERQLARIEFQPRDFRPGELSRYVRRLGKAKMGFNLPKTGAEFACFDAVCACHSRNVLCYDSEEQHRPVQYLVVLEVA